MRLAGLILATVTLAAQEPLPLEARYLKQEVRIPMRDGVELFTAIYTPRAAQDEDFHSAEQRVFRSSALPSWLELPILK